MHFLSPVAVQISKALAPESIEDKERFCVLSKFGVSLQDYVSQINSPAKKTSKMQAVEDAKEVGSEAKRALFTNRE